LDDTALLIDIIVDRMTLIILDASLSVFGMVDPNARPALSL